MMDNYVVNYNADLKTLNSYGINTSAKYLFHPRNNEEVQDIIKLLNNDGIKWYILGDGSNVILPDDSFDGAIIKLDLIDKYEKVDNKVYVSSGMRLSTFINKMLDDKFVNLAPLMGIPGTVGGAIVGNAGSYGTDIFSNLIDILVLNENLEIVRIDKENIEYGYRYTEFKENNKIVILGATFNAQSGNILEAKELIKNNMLKRINTQPLEFKNAGSVFKNPNGYSAGALIEECGLKGYSINDAKVSEKHANFIINVANAQSSDIIQLISFIRDEVSKKKGIELELEQVILKW